MQILLATSNPGKARELRTALADTTHEFVSLADLTQPLLGEERGKDTPEETGTTFAENAQIKAEYWCAQTGLTALADDSGILVDALPGELGVQTVRWGAGPDATDSAWLACLLERLKDIPNEKRGAEFVCVLALARSRQPIEYFEGRVRGTITLKPAAPILSGIPLSSVFVPEGASEVFAAMSTVEKSQYSHRGRALEKLKGFLTKLST